LSDGAASLVGGAFWLSLGLSVTAAAFVLAPPGRKIPVAIGAIVVGLVALVRGLARWSGGSIPWRALAVAALAPPLGIALVLGGAAWWRGRGRAERQAAEDARLRRAQAVNEEARAEALRQAADAQRARAHEARVARARDLLLTSSDPLTRCDAAVSLGQARAHEAIPDLIAVLERTMERTSVRNCAAGSLVELGEFDRPVAFYVECAAAGTSQLKAIARSGFTALARIGPAAEAALGRATAHPDPGVRDLATEGLAPPPR
jgi:hypothetical protein